MGTIWKRIRAENLMLFNDCIQKSGGVLFVTGSFTDVEDGTLYLDVDSNVEITNEQNERYNQNRKLG